MKKSLFMAGILCLTPLWTLGEQTRLENPTYGVNIFGEPLALPYDFPFLPYVNPDAPKRGTITLASTGGYDSFNMVLIKGRVAAGINMIYDTLLTSSAQEEQTKYGLLAKSMEVASDQTSVTFILHPEAVFHDGMPVTSKDVVWSFQTLKKHHPFFRFYYKGITEAIALGPHAVKFVFEDGSNKEYPSIVGDFPILPYHYWQKHDITKTTSIPPLGSGPYMIKSFELNRDVSYKRNPTYWGQDLPINRGQSNFDVIRFDYYKDDSVAFEAFKSGRVDYRWENIARQWATGYDIPAVKNGDIIRQEVPIKISHGMQGFFFNMRRERFKDRRVRRALNEVFDFMTYNRLFFYNQYQRTTSFFSGTQMASSGLPTPDELRLFKGYEEFFPTIDLLRQPHKVSQISNKRERREAFLKALKLFEQAGWSLDRGILINKEGKNFSIEFLLGSPQKIVLAFKNILEKLGIEVYVRVVDPAQYRHRVNVYDYDMIMSVIPQSLSPGNEQWNYWGSQAAEQPGSNNLSGIKSPLVDSLIEKIVAAPNKKALLTAAHALDRVLLWTEIVIPHWYAPIQRIAYWKRLAHPPFPAYSLGFPEIWWKQSR